jgi:Tol biopolymer transport system component
MTDRDAAAPEGVGVTDLPEVSMHTVTEPTMGRQLLTARRRAWIAALLGAALLAPAGAAYAATHDTTLVSRAAGGAKANDGSGYGAVSNDGRYVAFWSEATNLSPDDGDPDFDLYRRDRAKDTTVLVSRASGADGPKATGLYHGGPAISADGRAIAFMSDAQNLTKDDRDDLTDVFVRDVESSETTLVSRASGAAGAKSNQPSAWTIAISPDGRFVAFATSGSNLAPEQPTVTQVYLRDRQTETTTLVSRATGAGAPAGLSAGFPAISTGGRYVAFATRAKLGPDDHDTRWDVYVRDLARATTALVSRASGKTGADGGGDSRDPAISADGRFVAFSSTAMNLSAADGDASPHVYVRDRGTSTTTLVSRATGAAGAAGDSYSYDPAISGDGRRVAFSSDATNLSVADATPDGDTYARELPALVRPPFGDARAAAAVAGKREPYPPARLWYRVTVEFKGLKVFTDQISGLPDSVDAKWKLESRHAVRLTLLCVNVKLDPGPFVLSERIRGRQRRVGGCPRPTKEKPRKNLRETVRFAATANGAVTRWQHDQPIDFRAGCPGRVEHQELVERHPLTGTISSPSSATEGLAVFADAVRPSTVTANAKPIQCLLTPQGPVYEKPAIASSFPHVDFLFGDGIEQVNGKLISKQLAVRFPPERFGRDFSYTRTLVQPEEGPDPAKDYTYKVRFTACPRHGRDVENCT